MLAKPDTLKIVRSRPKSRFILTTNEKTTYLKLIKPQFYGFLERRAGLFVKFQCQNSRVHDQIFGAEKKMTHQSNC